MVLNIAATRYIAAYIRNKANNHESDGESKNVMLPNPNAQTQLQVARVTAISLLSLVSACSEPNQYQPPPPPSVTVAKPVVQTVTNYLDETGTTEAVERIEIRARVRGYLEEVNFQDGQDINEGDKLYLIQPREYQAKVAAAKSELESKNVELARAKIELERQENLFKDNATAETTVVQAKAEHDAAVAAVDAAKAALDQAELDLEYTTVTSPINGRVERTLVKRGNLVGDSEATHLTTVLAYDPIHVYFNISERALLRATRETRRESSGERDITNIKAYLRRAVDKDFIFEGNLDYADLGVDQSTGTFTMRAIFPNPNLDLFPGLFVRIRIPLGTLENAVLLPERSIGADQAGRYVMIVGDQNAVERRNVEVGSKHGEMMVILEGLSGTETVVIDGIQRARPGGKVTPNETQLPKIEGRLESVEEGSQPPVDNEGQDPVRDATSTSPADSDPGSEESGNST